MEVCKSSFSAPLSSTAINSDSSIKKSATSQAFSPLALVLSCRNMQGKNQVREFSHVDSFLCLSWVFGSESGGDIIGFAFCHPCHSPWWSSHWVISMTKSCGHFWALCLHDSDLIKLCWKVLAGGWEPGVTFTRITWWQTYAFYPKMLSSSGGISRALSFIWLVALSTWLCHHCYRAPCGSFAT